MSAIALTAMVGVAGAFRTFITAAIIIRCVIVVGWCCNCWSSVVVAVTNGSVCGFPVANTQFLAVWSCNFTSLCTHITFYHVIVARIACTRIQFISVFTNDVIPDLVGFKGFRQRLPFGVSNPNTADEIFGHADKGQVIPVFGCTGFSGNVFIL